ncbi:MAG: putative DNA binding domain-containing protein [Bryobacteraceae bacterium]|nr:putative DNA binding domain-containing protein [Bryobacteraceae bacterium]
MLTEEELLALKNDLESDRVERKASAAETEKIAEAVCAFANDMPGHGKPGVIFVGLRDDGSCAGLVVTDELLRKLADIRSSGNIVPIPRLTVQKRVLEGCELAIVIVEPSDAPPVRYKGRVCIRVGPRRAIADAQEERILTERRRARDLPWDVRPLPSAGLEDLDLLFFQREYLPAAVSPELLEQNQRSVEQQLAALRFLSPPPQTHATPTGLLVCGKDPRRWVPGAYVQFLRLDGDDLAAPIRDQKELEGTLPDVLRRLDEVLEANIQVRTDLSGGPLEIRRPDYPLPALQQIARNAIMHRDYEGSHAPVRIYWFENRVEIHNPGGPFGQVNRQNFGQPGVTDYRNPHIAEALRNLGYVQKFGVGIALARKAMEKNGNPGIEFEVTDRNVLAVLRRRA